MKRVRMVAVGLGLALASVVPDASGGELVWTPRWTQGKYWVVRSPMMQPRVDHRGNQIGEEKIGDYFTKFRVASVESAAGGRRAKIEIRWKENDESAYQDNPEHVELEMDLLNLTVLRMTQYGIDARGQEFALPWTAPREQVGKLPFCWFWDVDVLPGATASLPLVDPVTTTPGAFVVKSRNRGSEWPFEQVVDVQGSTAFVTMEAGSCKSERLRLGASAAWYDIVDASGNVLREVVEVGRE